MSNIKTTYCSLPWVHLATHPHGGVTLCCVSDHTNSMNRARNFLSASAEYLDLNKDSVTKVMNSDYFREVRLQMLNNEQPEACKRCYTEEANGVRSKRLEENERLNYTLEEAIQATAVDGSIVPNFKFIELRLGNLCNIKCRTCNPASSTSWASEYKQLQHVMKFATRYDSKIDTRWTETDAFWDDLLNKSGKLELLYINGGEPTLVEKHWTYLERLIKAGLNKQITLWYNINMTHLPDKLIELWKQFKAVEVSASIDDLYDRNEYIRTGTKWADVERNLDKLQSLPWIKTSVCQTVSWLNIGTLNEFHTYMAARKLHVHMNIVHDPKFLSISVLPKHLLIDAIRTAHLDEWKTNALMSMVNMGAHDDTLLTQGIAYNDYLDSVRNTSFAKVFPNWSKQLYVIAVNN